MGKSRVWGKRVGREIKRAAAYQKVCAFYEGDSIIFGKIILPQLNILITIIWASQQTKGPTYLSGGESGRGMY